MRKALSAPCIMKLPNPAGCLFIRNETNSKNRKREKPCDTSIFAKSKRLIVSDTLVSKLSTSFGGGEGSRTPVRKHFLGTFSGRRHLFGFPRPPVKCHTDRVGSFIMHGTRKALRTHVHHSSTPTSGPWYSRCRRPLVRQRQEQFCCCSLIYNCPF